MHNLFAEHALKQRIADLLDRMVELARSTYRYADDCDPLFDITPDMPMIAGILGYDNTPYEQQLKLVGLFRSKLNISLYVPEPGSKYRAEYESNIGSKLKKLDRELTSLILRLSDLVATEPTVKYPNHQLKYGIKTKVSELPPSVRPEISGSHIGLTETGTSNADWLLSYVYPANSVGGEETDPGKLNLMDVLNSCAHTYGFPTLSHYLYLEDTYNELIYEYYFNDELAVKISKDEGQGKVSMTANTSDGDYTRIMLRRSMSDPLTNEAIRNVGRKLSMFLAKKKAP